MDSANKGESRTWGEFPTGERASLARRLEAAGYGGCAYDLEAADDHEVVDVAYAIVRQLEEGYDARREDDELLAQDIKDWADRHDRDL